MRLLTWMAWAALQAGESDRTPLKYEDFMSVAERNMFSPVKPKKPRKEEARKEEPKKAEAPKPPMIRGMADFGTEFRVLVEDGSRKSRFYKAGDSLAGGVVESVEKLQVVLRFGEERRTFRNGEALPLAGGGEAAPATQENAAELEKIKERLKKKRSRTVVEDEE